MNITTARQQIADALIGTMGRHIAEEQAKEWARAVTVNKRKIKKCLEEKSGPQAKEEIGSLLRKTLGEHIPTEMAQDWGRAVFKNKKKILEVFKNLENKDEKMSEETNKTFIYFYENYFSEANVENDLLIEEEDPEKFEKKVEKDMKKLEKMLKKLRKQSGKSAYVKQMVDGIERAKSTLESEYQGYLRSNKTEEDMNNFKSKMKAAKIDIKRMAKRTAKFLKTEKAPIFKGIIMTILLNIIGLILFLGVRTKRRSKFFEEVESLKMDDVRDITKIGKSFSKASELDVDTKTNEDVEEIQKRSGMLSEMSGIDFNKDPESIASEVIRNARKQKMKEDEITTELDTVLKRKDIKSTKKKKIKSAVKKQLGIESKAYAKETEYSQPNQEGYTGKSRQNKMYKKKDTKLSKGKKDQPKQSGYSGSDKKEKMYAKSKKVSEDILDKVNASDDDKRQKMKLVEAKGHKEEFDFHCKYCAEGFNEEDALRKHQMMCGS